jgi:hypothetical protein
LTVDSAFCERFFGHYNHEHRHSGIGLHTPASVHYGTADQVRDQRRKALHAAYAANPARFGHRRPEHTERMNPDCLTGLDTFRSAHCATNG